MLKTIIAVSCIAGLAACSSTNEGADAGKPQGTPLTETWVNPSALVKMPETVSCTLESGGSARCTQYVVKALPDSLDIGPFCPATLDDEGGIWYLTGQNEGLYRVNRAYFEMLDRLGYTFYDADGTVHIADISVAQPVYDHACINVSLKEDVEITLLIPDVPVKAATPQRLGTVNKIGLAATGTPIFSDAPTIQMTGHMPALDTCGGHIDPGGWYHWHANSSDIEGVYETSGVEAHCHLPQEASALFGYAFDGFPIYGRTDLDGAIPVELDECQGHATSEMGYHYHTGDDFPNLPPCLVGVQAQDNFTTTADAGVGAMRTGGANPPRPNDRGGPMGGPEGRGAPPGFAEAASKLGVTEAELFQAVQNNGGPRVDIDAAAAELGVTSDALREALPPPPAGGRGPAR